MNNSITPAQEKAISYHLWKTTDQISNEEWLKVRSHIDKSTASDIITSFNNGNMELAVNQIKHLCQK